MRADPCEKRHDLSLKLYVAVEAVYEAKERYAAAKNRKAANTLDLHRALAKARATERTLVEAIREHIENHGCIH
jgi:hypothetical protein